MNNVRKLNRIESFKRLINLVLSAGCLALEIGVFAYHWLTYFQYSLVEPLRKFYFNGHLLQLALYGFILFFLSNMYGGMRLGYLKNSEIIFSQIFSTIIADILLYAQLSLMAFQLFMPRVFVIMFMEQVLMIVVYINLANRLFQRIFPPRKLLLLYGNRSAADICAKFETRKDKYKIVEKRRIDEDLEAIKHQIQQKYEEGVISGIILWDIPDFARKELLKFCYAKSIRVYYMPKITDVIMLGAEELHIFDSPVMLTREYSLTMEQRVIKRTIDIVGSLILIILSSPFMLLTALAVKLYDGGPILYKQIRCTIHEREFEILKFRSMRVDAEKDGVARLASKNDSRITPVGKVIRKCRLDELPQLFNILKGDMSFIGPRPERPEIIAQYKEVMPEFVYRMKVKAGLAGFAQVYGKYNTSPYDKLKLDLTYIEKYSVPLDLKLMLLTLKILFWPDSTEGVEAEQITALKNERGDKL